MDRGSQGAVMPIRFRPIVPRLQLRECRGIRGGIRVAIAGVLLAGLSSIAGTPISGQARSTYRAPRTADGKPDLNGIWQAVNAAHWDLQGHPARSGPVVSMGALGAIPGGIGVVEGGEIPYQPAALAKKKENAEHWLERDPAVKCYLPGVPRATYMPFPFQIIQTPETILIAHEFANASRTLYVNGKDKAPLDSWMGWSNARWEGETLVVDTAGFNDQTWLDAAGNFHSEAMHVVERFTRTSPDHLMYEATIEDPQVFTRPWKIQMPLYRRVEANAQLVEFRCVEFVEELMYGHLKKKTGN
jgi:hypothetical protein